jgi:hypothetical protein
MLGALNIEGKSYVRNTCLPSRAACSEAIHGATNLHRKILYLYVGNRADLAGPGQVAPSRPGSDIHVADRIGSSFLHAG